MNAHPFSWNWSPNYQGTGSSRSVFWLALVIGNSRLHWAQFVGSELQQAWDTPHLPKDVEEQLLVNQFDFSKLSPHPPILLSPNSPPISLYIASVVPTHTVFWKDYPKAKFLSLEQVPLQGIYPTLGIDRALALWGAIATVGSPALVIDAGTALTFTGADMHHHLIGGAILPGLRLQLQALGQRTAALPEIQLKTLPSRWALDTEAAIASGVIHTLLAGMESFIKDWWQKFPQSAVVLTGGDGDLLQDYLNERSPNLATKVRVDPHLIFWGIQAIQAKSYD